MLTVSGRNCDILFMRYFTLLRENPSKVVFAWKRILLHRPSLKDMSKAMGRIKNTEDYLGHLAKSTASEEQKEFLFESHVSNRGSRRDRVA